MEKYFVAQLDELNQRRSRSKLIEVTFSRRPSTFGVLYVTQRQTSSSLESWLKLATLSLTLDNKAKFMIVREIRLDGQVDNKSPAPKGRAHGQKFLPIVDFDTMPSGQLLIEGAISSSAKQALNSSVFLLTCGGHLLVASMIGQTLSQVPNGSLVDSEGAKAIANSQRRETFVQIKTVEHCVDGHEDVRNDLAQVQVDLFMLSLSILYLYTLKIQQNNSTKKPQDYDLKLTYKYSLISQSDQAKNSLQFVRMLPLAPGPNGRVVLLELSDGSVQVVQRNKCLASLPGLCRNVAQSLLLLAPSNADNQLEPDFLLSVTNSNQIVANSLIIRRDLAQVEPSSSLTHSSSNQGDETTTEVNEMHFFGQTALGVRKRSEKDPDGLLLEEPNFELEHCWTLNLNEFRGIRSMFEDGEDDDDDEDDGDNVGRDDRTRPRRHTPGLCLPIWTSSGASSEPDRRPDGQPNAWPRFLLVFCQRNLLMFGLEQANVLPFSVVYDRAFLNLTYPVSSSNDDLDSGKKQTKQQTLMAKQINLRLKPKLLHNVKLIGTRASDNLFNMLLLTSRIRLVEASNFNHLSLLAAISNEGHILAFKLTSKQLLGPNHKDNLYQQLLADSLRDSALLQDELHRMRQMEQNLEKQTTELEKQLNLVRKANVEYSREGEPKLDYWQRVIQSSGDSFQIATSLLPNQSDTSGNLFDLVVSWSSVMLPVRRVVIVSYVEGSQLRAVSDESSESIFDMAKFKGISIGNAEWNKFYKSAQGTNSITASICSYATIEFDHEGDQSNASESQDIADFSHSSEGISRRNQLVVSMSLEDYKTGILSVYLVYNQKLEIMNEATRIVMKYRFSRQYMKQELEIKLLNSFRFVPPEEREITTKSQFESEKLSFSGAFELEQAFAWLGKLVDLPNEAINTGGKERISLEFMSISRQGRIQIEVSSNRMKFSGNVPKTLDLIKQQILKQATDSSIQLEVTN